MQTITLPPPKRSWFSLISWAILLAVLVISWKGAEMDPLLLFKDSGNMATFAADFFPPDFSQWQDYLGEMATTLQIAVWGTALAVILSIPFGLMSAENIVPWWVYQPMRRLMDACRAINEMVFAMLFVATAEWLFWDEFGVRFNFIAVDYLVYSDEVLNNLLESYPLGLLLSGLGVLAALLALALRAPLSKALLAPLHHAETAARVTAERALNKRLNGGCQVPMGVHGTIHRGQLTLKALIASVDGQNCYEGEMSGPAKSADIIGRNLAKALYEEGGKTIIADLKQRGILK